MTKKIFTATNGVELGVSEDTFPALMLRVPDSRFEEFKCWDTLGGARFTDNVPGFTLNSDTADALREFFLHERDTELGRWRSVEQPNIVAYLREREPYRFVDENTGESEFYSRRQAGTFGDNPFSKAAEEYFDAHPEPKPWHDAKPGEVWELNTDSVPGRVVAWSTFEGVFMDASQNWVTGVDIISGKRIWPEEEN